MPLELPDDVLDCDEVVVRRDDAVSAAREYDRPAADESAESLMSDVAVADDSSSGRAADTERDGNEAVEALTRAERRVEDEEDERGDEADCRDAGR